ncbi:MAG: TetR/AcrR family transcriptional regulator, partial [Acidimicrobiales bacterium]|nr:TetR/AcrR family transcriptional regulator [Acidimicrobiales bacterium]
KYLHVYNSEQGTIRERGMKERRDRIVDAAADLVSQGNVSALTMRALSGAAGVSVPTVYNLIGSREDVLIAVIERAGEAIEPELAALGGDPIERCFRIADCLITRVTAPTSLIQSVYAEGLGPAISGSGLRPLRQYGLATGLAILEAAECGDLELITTVQLLAESLMIQLAVRIAQWVSADLPPDPDHLQAEAAHAVAMTLIPVATVRTRPELLRRLSAARTALTV